MNNFKSGGILNADVDTLETVAEIAIRGQERLLISFLVGVADLTNFDVAFKVHPNGSYFTVANAAGDFTTPVHPVIKASSDLNLAAAGATVHWLMLDVRGVHAVRLQAAGTSSTVTGHFGCA